MIGNPHLHLGPLDVDQALTVEQDGKAVGFVLSLQDGKVQHCMLLQSAPTDLSDVYNDFKSQAAMTFRGPKLAEKYEDSNGLSQEWSAVTTKAEWDTAVAWYSTNVGLLGTGTYTELVVATAPTAYADWKTLVEDGFPPPPPPPPPPPTPIQKATHEQGRYAVTQDGTKRAMLDVTGSFTSGTREVWLVLDSLSRDTAAKPMSTSDAATTSAGNFYKGTFDFKTANSGAKMYLASWSWS